MGPMNFWKHRLVWPPGLGVPAIAGGARDDEAARKISTRVAVRTTCRLKPGLQTLNGDWRSVGALHGRN